MSYKEPQAIVDREETQKLAKERGFANFKHISNEAGCFTTETVTIKGIQIDYQSHDETKGRKQLEYFKKRGIEVYADGNMGDEYNTPGWKAMGCEAIPGLRCPYCAAQAYYTDYEKVAVCGACPGWYFFYEGVKNEGDGATKNKIVMKYLNGILQPVVETDTGVEVGETKF